MKILEYFFSFGCFSATFGMTVFWCYKYWLDEDLCLVDYKNFDDSNNIDYPMISMCLANCLIESKLKQYNPSFTEKDYIEYLKGNIFNQGMEKVDFDIVTPDLKKLLLGHFVEFKNGGDGQLGTSNFFDFIQPAR